MIKFNFKSARLGNIFIFLYALAFCQGAYAYKLKCTKDQSSCQVKTKRLVKGDYVGIFDEDSNLIATGRVENISGETRNVKVIKRYSKILKEHEAIWIKDDKAKNPEKNYSIAHSRSKNDSFSILAGYNQMAIGNGFSAYNIDFLYERKIYNETFWFIDGGYLSGKGQASDTGDELETFNINLSAFSLLGGLALYVRPSFSFSARGSVQFGLSKINLSSDGAVEAGQLVNDKITTGNTTFFKADLNIILDQWEIDPYIGACVFRLQSSLNTCLQVGVFF